MISTLDFGFRVFKRPGGCDAALPTEQMVKMSVEGNENGNGNGISVGRGTTRGGRR